MNKEEWIQEAHSQIMVFESNIKYLKGCKPDEYEESRFFKNKKIIKNLEKQIKFLKDGIYIMETLSSITPENY